MAIEQLIRAHNYPFRVVSDRPLSSDEQELITEGLEAYDRNAVQRLSEGTKGEPPLTFRMDNYETTEDSDGGYAEELNLIWLPYSQISILRWRILHSIKYSVSSQLFAWR